LCGIMGYVGDRQAVPIVYDGLACLEYRGYDSAGIAIQDGESIWLQKKKGRLSNLDEILKQAPSSTTGIGHTRWATHGVPSDRNSHPHTDCLENIALLHNGIIENFAPLKAELIARGHIFKSDTDTEVMAHLVEEEYKDINLEEAVRRALTRVEGAYAIAVISNREPGVIVAARKDSPLVIGLGEGENYLASDIPALLPHTRKVYILNDYEMAVLTKTGVRITDFQGNTINKEVFPVTWDAVAAEKGGYEHFMLKEIFEQPHAIRETLRGRIQDDRVDFGDPELKELVRGVDKVFITACGTAYHAGVVGKLAIERLAQLPVEIDVASEFRYRDVLWGKNTMLIVVSQSGETADTLAALREAKRQGVKVLAVTNVVGSSAAREADHVIYTLAGPEIAVASTKAYTTQLIVMFMLAVFFAQERKTLWEETAERVFYELNSLPHECEQVLALAGDIEKLANLHADSDDAFFIGRGLDHAVAMEGALKLKEISYVHAEAYAAGELKHGTLALITDGVPVLALVTQNSLKEKMISNIREVKARGGQVIGIVRQGLEDVADECDQVYVLPGKTSLLAPVLAVLPLQLYAYYMAVKRGCDVDKPRNLAKSVTVE